MGRAKPPRRISAGEDLSGTNLSRAGDYNQRVTLQAIRTHGPITRADISVMTGLTAPAIANITNRLVKDRMIMASGRILGQRGQPATCYVVRPDGAFALGLNIDRDHIALLRMDLSGAVSHVACLECRFAMPETVFGFVEAQLARIRAEEGEAMSHLIGMGIGIPDDLGFVRLPHRPPEYEIWSRIDVAEVFAQRLGLPVFTENDATAAALGELQFGQGRRHQNFAYVLLSAGLGCGLIVNGAPFRGATQRAGEIGFLPVRDPSTGQLTRHSLQDVVSLYALYAFLRRRQIHLNHPQSLMAPDARLTQALDLWAGRAAEALVEPFLGLNSVLNPEAIFIGGRLPTAIIDRLCTHLNRHLKTFRRRIPDIARVSRAATASEAASMGAAVLVFQNRLLPQTEALMKARSRA